MTWALFERAGPGAARIVDIDFPAPRSARAPHVQRPVVAAQVDHDLAADRLVAGIHRLGRIPQPAVGGASRASRAPGVRGPSRPGSPTSWTPRSARGCRRRYCGRLWPLPSENAIRWLRFHSLPEYSCPSANSSSTWGFSLGQPEGVIDLRSSPDRSAPRAWALIWPVMHALALLARPSPSSSE